jgi:hypothetical protein
VKATEHDTHSIEDSLKKIRKITPRKRAGQRVKAAPAKRLNEPLMCNSFHQNYFYQKGMQPMRVQKVAEKLPGITAMANATTLLDRLGDREPHMQAYMAAPCPAPNSLHSSNDKLSRQEIIELGQLLPGCNPVVDSPSVVLSKARSHIRCLTEELMLLRQCKAKQPAAQK